MPAQPTHEDRLGSASGGASGHPYDRHYYENYPTASGPTPYDRRCGQWLEFFGAIADRVVAEIKPKKVLDVGCAKGFLVEALRDRGVEAFGIDISEYAIGEVRPDIRPYCRVASAVDPLNDRYDLIICIEVLEHMSEEEGRQAIASFCRSTEGILFSSTPDDFDEPTHVNVRPRSFWIERFAEHGFTLDVDFDASFIASHAMRFRAGLVGGAPLDAVLAQRDRLQSDLTASRLRLADLTVEQDRLQRERDRLQSELATLHMTAEWKDRLIAERDRVVATLNAHIFTINQTIGWKVLERLRRVRDRALPPGSRRRDAYGLFRRAVEVLLDWRGKDKIRQVRKAQEILSTTLPQETLAQDPAAQYQVWLQRHRLTPRDIASMKAAVETFTYTPLISILAPVHDTDETWLRKAIESVRAQIYPHWELCLVNDASTRPHVRPVLDEYAAIEPRVRVKHLARNEGIAGASTHALTLATGDFVALLDHDDELSPDALFEVAKRLNEARDLDLLYSDEDKLELDGRRVEPFFKPDWSPDLLLSMNYITHLSAFRRSLLVEISGFRLGLDGSQDYDLLLRFTERTSKIAHIPKVLYHWRKIPGSAAASPVAKPFAYEAGRRAIAGALQRRGYEGQVESVLPGIYTLRYQLRGSPLVSIIIPIRDRWQLLAQCLRSIEESTSYPRYEVMVIDNDSTDPETLRYLESISGKWRTYRYPQPFNFSAINNFGAAQARGEYLLFLNNDTRVIRSDWLTAMLEQAQRPEVGAVGARLHYPDGRIQHAGIVLGVGRVAHHAFKNLPGEAFSHFGLADVVRNCSAVTAACMMVPRRAFEDVKGFDERFRVSYNDVDLCLRLRQRGYLIVYTPFALLCHYESLTRGELQPPEDEELVWRLWGDLIRQGDPYYNPNLTRSRPDWSLDV